MDSVWLYIKLGFEHVLDPNGLDHFLFLIVLALPYGWQQGKALVGWVTLFTVGHTLALWAAYSGWLSVDGKWIEFLIPITIGWMAVNVILEKKKATFRLTKQRSLMFITLLFGLIHGLGFGRYFSLIVLDEGAYGTLFQFAVGVELAQLLIVLGMVVVNFLVLDIFHWKIKKWQWVVAAMVLSQALVMTLENIPA